MRTAQEEFDYPSGADNVKTRYDGKGGFPVSSFPMRLAAAIHQGDANILLTGYLTPDSRMMIHSRIVRPRVELAPFLQWDPDPYLVITAEGRLVWMVDGYTTMTRILTRARSKCRMGNVNYIRNSVKATVDAYDGKRTSICSMPRIP